MMRKTLSFPSALSNKTIFLSILFLIISIKYSLAQTETETGELSGTITDRISSISLTGASVNIVATNKGAIANNDGGYVINRIPPGIYNLRFSMIGYKTLIKTNVSVSPGRTTELSVQLELAPIDVGTELLKRRNHILKKTLKLKSQGEPSTPRK